MRRAAACLIALAVGVWPGRAWAQLAQRATATGVTLTAAGPNQPTVDQAITVQVFAGYGGYYRPGHWTPVDVVVRVRPTLDLMNLIGETLEGVVRVSIQTGARRREVHAAPVEVTLPGERRLSFLVLPEADRIRVEFQPDLGRLRNSSIARELGRVAGVVEMRPAATSAVLVGAFEHNERVLRDAARKLPGTRRMQLAPLRPATVPGQTGQWFGLDACVMTLDALADLPPAVQDSLLDWVSVGGHLVVTYRGPYATLPESVEAAMPATVVLSRRVVAGRALEEFGRAPVQSASRAFVAVDQIHPRGSVLLRDGSLILITRRVWGSGTVTFAGADLAGAPFSDWAGAPRMWARLLPARARIESGQQPVRARVLRALLRFHDISEAGLSGVFVSFAVYAGLVGAGLSWIMRRLAREEWYWPGAGLLVGLVVVATFSSPRILTVSRPAVQTISLVRARSGTNTGRAETYALGTAPVAGNVDVSLPGAGGIRAYQPTGELAAEEVVQEMWYAPGAVARHVHVGPTRATLLLSTGVVAGLPAVQFTRAGKGVYVVRNNTSETLTDLNLILGTGSAPLGALAPGEAVRFNPAQDERFKTWKEHHNLARTVGVFPRLLRLLPQPIPGVPGVFQHVMGQESMARALGADPMAPTLTVWWPYALVAAGQADLPPERRGHTLLALTPGAAEDEF